MADSQISNLRHSGLNSTDNPYSNNNQYNYNYNNKDVNPYIQAKASNNFVGDYNQPYIYPNNQTVQSTNYQQNQIYQYQSLQSQNYLKNQAVYHTQYTNNYPQHNNFNMSNHQNLSQTLNPEYLTYTDPNLMNQSAYQYQAQQQPDSSQVNSQHIYSKTDASYTTSEYEKSNDGHSEQTKEKSEGSVSVNRRSRSSSYHGPYRNRSVSKSSRSRSRHRRSHRRRSRSHRSRRRHRHRYRSRSRSRSYDRHSRRRNRSSRHRSSRGRSRYDSRSPDRSRRRSLERPTSKDRSHNSRNRSRSTDSRHEQSNADYNNGQVQADKPVGQVGIDVLEKARMLRSSEIEKRRMRDIEEAQRDDLTVLVYNMNLSVDERDIYELFSEHAGKVRDIQCVRDSRSGRSKGIAYVEFYTQESVIKALSMNGMSLKGQGIRVQSSQAEKNRAARAARQLQESELKQADNPTTIMVSNLVGVLSTLSEGDLQQLFAPFGNVAEVAVARNEMGNSKGYAYIRFKRWNEAREALNVMNGFDINGQSIKVSYVTSNKNKSGKGSRLNELGDMDIERLEDEESGLISGSSNKIALMKKLQQRVNSTNIVLSNMYTNEDCANNPEFFDEIEEDVKEECKKYGEVVKVFLNTRKPDGKVYVKFKNSTDAQTATKALQGRYFAGNTIQVGYLTDDQFNSLTLS